MEERERDRKRVREDPYERLIKVLKDKKNVEFATKRGEAKRMWISC